MLTEEKFMPTQLKKDEVLRLTQKISETEAIYLTNYQGLTYAELSEIRSKVNETGAEYSVIKNTLFRIALKEAGRPEAKFGGATAAIFAHSDPLLPLQSFAQIAKDRLKAAIAFGEFMVGDKLDRLVKMDSPEILKTKLVRQLASPMYGLARSLNWNIQRLVLVIDRIKEKKNG